MALSWAAWGRSRRSRDSDVGERPTGPKQPEVRTGWPGCLPKPSDARFPLQSEWPPFNSAQSPQSPWGGPPAPAGIWGLGPGRQGSGSQNQALSLWRALGQMHRPRCVLGGKGAWDGGLRGVRVQAVASPWGRRIGPASLTSLRLPGLEASFQCGSRAGPTCSCTGQGPREGRARVGHPPPPATAGRLSRGGGKHSSLSPCCCWSPDTRPGGLPGVLWSLRTLGGNRRERTKEPAPGSPEPRRPRPGGMQAPRSVAALAWRWQPHRRVCRPVSWLQLLAHRRGRQPALRGAEQGRLR